MLNNRANLYLKIRRKLEPFIHEPCFSSEAGIFTIYTANLRLVFMAVSSCIDSASLFKSRTGAHSCVFFPNVKQIPIEYRFRNQISY